MGICTYLLILLAWVFISLFEQDLFKSAILVICFYFKNSHKSDKSGISSFQALCTSLAARVGTGNPNRCSNCALIDCRVALGPFFGWVVAIIGMATSLIESTLAQLYKTKDDEGNYRGGPAYYKDKGLNMRWMGVLFAIFLIIAFGLVFNAVQANSIAQAAASAFVPDPLYVGIGLVVMSGFYYFLAVYVDCACC